MVHEYLFNKWSCVTFHQGLRIVLFQWQFWPDSNVNSQGPTICWQVFACKFDSLCGWQVGAPSFAVMTHKNVKWNMWQIWAEISFRVTSLNCCPTGWPCQSLQLQKDHFPQNRICDRIICNLSWLSPMETYFKNRGPCRPLLRRIKELSAEDQKAKW